MFTTLFTATLLSVAAVRGVRADFAINSPELVQCQDAHVSWQPTNAPYNLIVVPGEDACSDALADLGDHNGTTMTWNVHLPAGTKVMLSLEDATTDEAWSQVLTVQPSNDTSCLPGAQASSSSASSSSASSSSASSSSVPATTSVSEISLVTAATTFSAPPLPTETPSTDTNSTAPLAGAANAAANPLGNGGLAMRQLYTPAMLFSALGAAVFIAL